MTEEDKTNVLEAFVNGLGLDSKRCKIHKIKKSSSRVLQASPSVEVIFKITADPTGANTQDPSYIVEQMSRENCLTCFEKFVDLFEASSSGTAYKTEDIGSTDDTVALDTELTSVPVL